jgi:small subunit ribosomal protein S8
MTVTDSVADMLTRIRNAAGVNMESVEMPHSRMREEIARVLKEEGYIAKSEVSTKKARKVLRLILKYRANKGKVVNSLKRVSKPGRRVYVGHKSIPRVMSGFGTVIISTSAGIMTGSQARAKKVGGEILCYVS